MRLGTGILAAIPNRLPVIWLAVAGCLLAGLCGLPDFAAAQYAPPRDYDQGYDQGAGQQDDDQEQPGASGPGGYDRQPGYGRQDSGQPGYGQPNNSQPRYGQPAYPGQLQNGQQQNGQPAPNGQPVSQHEMRCRALEQQLSGDWSRGQGQDQLPRLEEDIRQSERVFQKAQYDIEQANCYEDMFIFGRSLKHTPKCTALNQQVEDARRRVTIVRQQREAILNRTSNSARRDTIVAELARNRCGENYQRQYASQQQNSSFFSIFGDNSERLVGEEPRPGDSSYGAYRTMCVRLCDGFYFPVSFAASQTKFRDDEARCQQSCAAPAALYTYRNPGEEVDMMVSLDGKPYKDMPNANRHRKQYIKGCSCRANEYSQQEIVKSERALKAEAESRRTAAKGKGETAAPPPAPSEKAPPPADGAPPGEQRPRG
jgi:hypothetical protein